jgi:hypothetical protein
VSRNREGTGLQSRGIAEGRAMCLCKHEMTGRPQPPQHLSPYFYTGAQIPFSPVAQKEPH